MNSRSKGNRNERRAAELISVWTGRKFSKTPASGGLQWKKSFSKGDIVCTKEGHFFPFCVEVKAHREIDFSHLIIPEIKNVKIFEFWSQCKRDAKACDKVPMLLMRYDRLPGDFFFLVLPDDYFVQLGKEAWVIKRLTLGHRNLVFMDSRDFFKLPYKEIKLKTKQYLKEHGQKESR